MNVILASQSPRRKELMRLLFDRFSVCPAKGDEVIPPGLEPHQVPVHLAKKKAEEIAVRYPRDLVLSADTVVLIGGRILGKPKDPKDAETMLKTLSGAVHTVVTGCSIRLGKRAISFADTAKVTFYDLTDEEIQAYIATGEPMDKAGAYGIQGKGALFVKKIDGDFYNVMGFPVPLINRKLKDFYQKIQEAEK